VPRPRHRPGNGPREIGCLAVAVGVALLLWSAYVPWPGGRLDVQPPAAQLQAMRPTIAGLAVVVGLIGASLTVWRLLTGIPATRTRLAAPAIVLVAGLGAFVETLPRTFDRGVDAPAGAATLTVATVNTLAGRADVDGIVTLVRDRRVDVVALPETHRPRAAEIVRALERAGVGGWSAFTDAAGGSVDAASPTPTSLLVRERLRATPERAPGSNDASPDGARGAFGHVRVRLDGAPGRPLVAAVHPRPPLVRRSTGPWRDDLEALEPLCRRADTIIAGDLNATVDHSPLRELLGAGCESAAARTGHGMQATWTGGPLGVVRPQIDHVLSTAPWRAVDAGVVGITGSDHRAVWARLVRTGG